MVAVGTGTAPAAATYTKVGGSVVVSTGYDIVADHIVFLAAEVAGTVVETDLSLPEDARVEEATFAVTAQPGGFTELRSVAQVRPATAMTTGARAATVDFGRIVTVGGLGFEVFTGAPDVSRVFRWTGASWSSLATSGSFPEVAGDRLLVETTTSGVSADELAAALTDNGTVDLPALPSSLELLVDGTTVWFERQGSAAGAEPDAGDGAVSFVVERTDAVREAFARAPVVGGERTVRVALRAAAPGRLQLKPTIAALRVHLAQFPPEGVVRSLDLAEEGVQHVDVTPPASATEVREVALVVRGSFGSERVQPPVGPVLVTDATLALAAARPVLVGLPVRLADRFGQLLGVRLPLVTSREGSGGEIGGRLLADDGGRPGAAVRAGELTPLTVAGDTDGWRTLSFADGVTLPQPPEPGPGAATPERYVAAWLELQLSYGEVQCRLTAAAGDAAAPGAPVLRRLPGGGTASLTTVPALGPLGAGIRLIGLPERDRPLPAVTLSVARSAEEVGVNPSGDDLPAVLTLQKAVRPADGPVELVATVAAPGSLTLDTVRVTYSEGGAP